MDQLDEFIETLESMKITQESTLGIFFKDPIDFIDNYQFKTGVSRDNEDYLGIVNADGRVYLEVKNACSELVSVNAYASALTLIGMFIEKLESLRNDPKTKPNWKITIDSSLEDMRDAKLKIQEARDTYESKRASTLAKYNFLLRTE